MNEEASQNRLPTSDHAADDFSFDLPKKRVDLARLIENTIESDALTSALLPFALLGTRRRLRGRWMRFLTRAAETRLHTLPQLLKRYIKRWYHEYPDRACCKHTAKDSGADCPSTDLGGAGGNYQRQQ